MTPSRVDLRKGERKPGRKEERKVKKIKKVYDEGFTLNNKEHHLPTGD